MTNDTRWMCRRHVTTSAPGRHPKSNLRILKGGPIQSCRECLIFVPKREAIGKLEIDAMPTYSRTSLTKMYELYFVNG